MVDKKQQSEEPGKFRQFLAAMVVNLSAMAYGVMVGWPSPVSPQLQSSDSPIGAESMSDEEISWLSGTTCLGGTVGSLAMGILAEKLGRKITCCLIAIPLSLCWVITIFATDQMHIFVARFLAGIGGSGCLFLVPIYVSEISSDSIRGMLGSLLMFMLNIGVLVAYILGTVLSFKNFAICSLVFPLLFLGSFVFMPETPVYLLRRNRLNQAIRSLMWLKAGHKPTVENELKRLQADAKEAASMKSAKFMDLFKDHATIRGLIISLGLFGGQQFCGIFAMITYTESIFKVSGSSLSPNMAVIIIGIIQMLGSYLPTILMERMGRRPLLLISCLGMCICHYILATFCYLQNLDYDVVAFGWIPVVALSIYMIAYCLGMGPGPYILTAEIFRRDIASLTSTVAMVFVWIAAFLVVKFFTNFVALLGMHGCFFLLGSFCAASFLFVYVLIPETKARLREDIIKELNEASWIWKVPSNKVSLEHV